MSRKGKVIVAMSGGVDSSVAACLLKQQGYECVGVFMCVGAPASEEATEGRANGWPIASAVGDTNDDDREAYRSCENPSCENPFSHAHPRESLPANAAGYQSCHRSGRERILGPVAPRRLKHGCCSASDALDARAIAGRLEILFHTLNFEQDFERIIAYFVDEYAQGRTPNPCVMCNIHLKFGKLLRYADMLGAEFVATGHHARIVHRGGQTYLAHSANREKDQSYVLFGIRREDLPRCLFPLGEIADKQQVRRLAAELGLAVHDKPESQEICFVPNDDYKQLVRDRRPETQRPGEVRDATGNVLDTHNGIANYTIGQRRGLGIATGTPIYVTQLDAATNTVIVGPKADLLARGLVADQINWLMDPPALRETRSAAIKIRYTHAPAPGSIRVLDSGEVEATFAEPQPAVTPGQAAVFYDEHDRVIAGGWIQRSLHVGRS